MPEFYCVGGEECCPLHDPVIESKSKCLNTPLKSPGPPWGEIINEEKEMALSLGRAGTSLSDTALAASEGRETPVSWRRGGSLSRRRKVSVPELGQAPTKAMTTVQEAGLDSPTIPGHPPLGDLSSNSNRSAVSQQREAAHHERSSSAPLAALKSHNDHDFINPRAPAPRPARKASADNIINKSQSNSNGKPKYRVPTLHFSRSLSPIFSPPADSPASEVCKTPPVIVLDEYFPQPLKLVGGGNTEKTRPALKVDIAATQQPVAHEAKPQVPPKTPSSSQTPAKTPKTPPRPWPIKHAASMTNLYTAASNYTTTEPISRPTTASPHKQAQKANQAAHLRNASDTSSIIDRGRPVKRTNSKKNTKKPEPTSAEGDSPKSDDGNWKLPTGLRPCEAVVRMSDSEKDLLRRQATSQAEQFEILGSRNVASLSRELRALDERCEYLRKTYKSLRAGRLKLHTRMITYLKSESLQFSKESLLRQEEALIELDKSIDDWILKLEQAENRRLRVRQKLLEHVAAAMTLNPILAPQKVVAGPVTPPGSPVRQPAASPRTAYSSPPPGKRNDLESIKIYADGQVLNLFSDIEQAVTKMCEAC